MEEVQMKKALAIMATVATVGATAMATPAEARWGHHGFFGPGLAFGLAAGALHIDVGAGDDPQNVEEARRFEIHGADIAASDDANRCFSVHILIMAQRASQPQRVL